MTKLHYSRQVKCKMHNRKPANRKVKVHKPIPWFNIICTILLHIVGYGMIYWYIFH